MCVQPCSKDNEVQFLAAVKPKSNIPQPPNPELDIVSTTKDIDFRKLRAASRSRFIFGKYKFKSAIVCAFREGIDAQPGLPHTPWVELPPPIPPHKKYHSSLYVKEGVKLTRKDAIALAKNDFLTDELLTYFVYWLTKDHEHIRVVTHVQLRMLVDVEKGRINFQRCTRTFDKHAQEMYPKNHLEQKNGTLIFFVNYPTNEHWVFVAAYGKPSSGVITIDVRSDNRVYGDRDNAHVAKCVAFTLKKILDSRLKTVKFNILARL